MSSPKRNRARILTASGLKKLREQMRSHEVEENAGIKYTLERLGELTGLDPETVKNVLDCKGSDKRTITRCFESFGLTLAESDHIPATQATITADPNFVGRDEAITDLNTLVSRNARVIVIQARGGVGKTTLARKYLQQELGSFLEFPIAKETKDIASIEGLLEEKLRQLGEEPGREFLVSLDRLKRKLQAERIGILIDNLEPALDSAGKFIEAHRRYVELLRVLSDPTVQSITLITSRERLREADVTVQHYSLRSLDVQAWSQFFQSRSINVETPVLAALHDAYGGNAKAMDIISGAVMEDFSGDVEAYWQANQDDLFIERDLEDLVAKQFDRLQELVPDAYKLLCRMGCYRYQDVPTVPIEGLFCLLWDVPENRHRRVIKSLQDRSLVDYENEGFWLHPVIRAEAISQLRGKQDWEISNLYAAEFWTDSVAFIETLSDALQALEAYYHYLEYEDFEKAGEVFEKRRISKWHGFVKGDALGGALVRLGLLQQLHISITKIINRISSRFLLGRLYLHLGKSYRFTGAIRRASACFENSRRLAVECLESTSSEENVEEKGGFEWLEAISLVNLGDCEMDLWEIEKAIKYYQLAICKNVNEYIEETCDYRLAFSHLCIGKKEIAIFFADKSYQDISKGHLGPLSRGHRFILLGFSYIALQNIDKASELYQRALSFSEESHYFQIKALAMSGLASIYRNNQNSGAAIMYLLEARHLLEEVGFKCDLAQVCYQLGLTYSDIDEVEKSNANFQEAIRLFTEMEAPKQVERVRRSMQNLNGG